MREQLRREVSSFSAELHQLAELDKTLDGSLEAHVRTQFNLAPKILEQRFKTLVKPHKDSRDDSELDSAEWLALFYRDMRELLLAELDVRLQPVLGLLEALNEQKSLLNE